MSVAKRRDKKACFVVDLVAVFHCFSSFWVVDFALKFYQKGLKERNLERIKDEKRRV
nr:MAG TPA: hypothetical protein [Caudoviricetes sp.]